MTRKYVIKKWYYNKLLKWNPKKALIKLYKFNTGHSLDFSNIKTYNEKIQWLKLNNKCNLLSVCADKFLVRNFVTDLGLEYILPRLLGVYDRPEEIDYDKLPEKFVLKLNHGWGYNIIVKDKSKLNIKETNKQLLKWKKEKFGILTGETHYFNIVPKIICEEYIETDEDNLRDYKVLCFNGKPKYIQVDSYRFQELKRDIYDLDWKKLELKLGYPNNNTPIEKPAIFEEMIQIAKILSSKFIHLRVDFYIVKNKLIFGEMTFTPSAGYKEFIPNKYNEIFGDLIDLNIR